MHKFTISKYINWIICYLMIGRYLCPKGKLCTLRIIQVGFPDDIEHGTLSCKQYLHDNGHKTISVIHHSNCHVATAYGQVQNRC